MFDRTTYFDSVRGPLFGGSLEQRQVDGQNAILNVWEWIPARFPDLVLDVRWLAYMLATAYHETSKEMWPIEEYGKGAGMEYGEIDPETGQTYHGRGLVQCTWRENYARADAELGLTGRHSCEWHAENQLDPTIAARTMFRGMYQGWFRAGHTLPRYFSASEGVDDPYGAREIINGDKSHVPSWSNGVSIGKLIEGYHVWPIRRRKLICGR
jgi:putative chitinase